MLSTLNSPKQYYYFAQFSTSPAKIKFNKKKKKKATTHTQKENTKKANRTEQWHRPADFIPPK